MSKTFFSGDLEQVHVGFIGALWFQGSPGELQILSVRHEDG